MSKLTKEEVSPLIRKLILNLKNPVIDPHPGVIIKYGDNLIPLNVITLITQTENLKNLVELYKSIGD